MRVLQTLVVSLFASVFAQSVFSDQLSSSSSDSRDDWYCHAPTIDKNSWNAVTGMKLASVVHVGRHGDRTPANVPLLNMGNFSFCSSYAISGIQTSIAGNFLQVQTSLQPLIDPASPFASAFPSGNCIEGQLTDVGISQLANIGQKMNAVYLSQLGLSSNADASAVWVRATNVWRTQQSAQSLLTAMFPQTTRPIPLHVMPMQSEYMYPNPSACPALNALGAKVCQSWAAQLEPYSAVIQKVATVFGVENLSSWTQSLDGLFDQLQVLTCHNQTLPCLNGVCLNSTDRDTIFALASQQWNYMFNLNATQYNNQIARLSIGSLLYQIQQNLLQSLSSVQQGSAPSPALFYYSGHDSTIAPLLGALNFTDWPWPPYASTMDFELWIDANLQGHIRLLYNGQVQQLSFCTTQICTMNEFIAFLTLVAAPPSQIASECAATSDTIAQAFCY